MEDFVRIFKSPQGDVYHITLSESNDVLSKSVLDALGDVHVVGIDLRRLEGSHVTDQKVLTALTNAIAEVFLRDENLIICYYCDFLNSIPNTKKAIKKRITNLIIFLSLFFMDYLLSLPPYTSS